MYFAVLIDLLKDLIPWENFSRIKRHGVVQARTAVLFLKQCYFGRALQPADTDTVDTIL